MVRGLMAVAAALALALPSGGASSGADPAAQVAQSASGSEAPRRHYRIRRPARLGPEDAAEIYAALRATLAAGYAASGDPTAAAYAAWPRYNSAPYLSATHGNLYVNNYANEAAAAYGLFEDAGPLPVGAIVAKDSFIVARDGTVSPGPLFVMEKMPAGFNYVSGNWRYTQINPDGELVGTTHGTGAERVAYCIGCHLAVEQQDHLFFVPDALRTRP